MAVIKTFNRIQGHLWSSEWSPEMTIEDAIQLIKHRRESHETGFGEEDFIGELNGLEVDPKEIKCSNCRGRLERQ